MSANIKTWEQRREEYYSQSGSYQMRHSEYFKDAEIADLRAALAAGNTIAAGGFDQWFDAQAEALKAYDREYSLRVWTAARSALAAKAVPDGWKLVPIRLTRRMKVASREFAGLYRSESARWNAILAAAPSPEEQEKP